MLKIVRTTWIYKFKFREMCKLCSNVNIYLLYRLVETEIL